MISDRDQRAFLEFASPPPEMRLSYCIGTTFTLDFSVLVQLALQTQGYNALEETSNIADEYKRLYEFQSKSVVYCQSCRIQKIPGEFFKPKKNVRQRLLCLLDSAIVSINTSDVEGTFHPKVWLLKFEHRDRKNESLWKLMVTSRNLTEAHTWEIGVELVGTRTNDKGNNKILREFFGNLLAKRNHVKGRKKEKELVWKAIEDLKTVTFANPEPFKNWKFLSKNGKGSSFSIVDPSTYKRVIAISPFLSKTAVKMLSEISDATLITGCKDVKYLEGYSELMKHTYIFKLPDMDLHAKLYLCQRRDGTGTDVFAGSANLTGAGILQNGKNIEAIIQLGCKLDLLKDFEKKFIFKDRARHFLYPWLYRLNEDDLEYSRKKIEEEKKLRVLEQVRADLAQGSFIMKRSGKKKWSLQWYGRRFVWDSEISATIRLSDGQIGRNLREVIEGGKITILSETMPMGLIWISVSKKKIGSIEFGSVVDVIGGSRRRNKEVFSEIVKTTDFASTLRSILSQSVGGSMTLSGPLKDSNGPRSKHAKKAQVEIEGYVEALLLSDLDSRSQQELITNTLKAYVNAGNSEAKSVSKFWSELQKVLNSVVTNVQ